MGFKTQIIALEGQIRKKSRELKMLIAKEKRSRDVWTKAFNAFLKAVTQHTELKNRGTKKEADLKKKILAWPTLTVELTKERDDLRTQIVDVKSALETLGLSLARIKEQEKSDLKATDEIVTQIFALNEVVVRAAADRESCLKRHVFPRLVTPEGKLLSQVTFDSADGLRRVVAMVNTMTLIEGDLAERAKLAINRFFDKFEQKSEMDETTKALFDLTRQLLVEKTDFKVGPELYRFLNMELDEEIFPELSEAQKFLRLSIRSEKTNSYIRIYQRQSRADNWEVVRQS